MRLVIALVVGALPLSAAWAGLRPERASADTAPTQGIGVRPLDLSGVAVRAVEPTVVLDSAMPGFISMMATAGGKVWATSYYRGAMVSIDPATNAVTMVSEDPAADLAAAGSTVVRTAFISGVVEKWNATTGQLEWRVSSDSPSGAAVVGDEVWVADHHGGTVSILGASDGSVLGRVTVGPAGDYGPAMPVLAGGVVWVTDYRIHKVIGIDAASRQVVARIPVPAAVQFCDVPAAVVGQALWISDCSTLITKIDLETLQATTVDAGSYVSAPLAIGDEVWVPVGELLVHLSDDLVADRAVSIPGHYDFGGVLAGGAAWINVGFGSVARLDSPGTW